MDGGHQAAGRVAVIGTPPLGELLRFVVQLGVFVEFEEAVFGALSSVILTHEHVSFQLIAGFALTFLAVIISETKLEFIRRKHPQRK